MVTSVDTREPTADQRRPTYDLLEAPASERYMQERDQTDLEEY